MTWPIYPGDIPYLTTEQMVEVDRAMMHNYKIELIQMMENAGRNLAHLARERFFDGDPRAKQLSSWPAPAGTAVVHWFARAVFTTMARRCRSSSPKAAQTLPLSRPTNWTFYTA